MNPESPRYFMDDPREAGRLSRKVDPQAWVSKFLQPLLPASGRVLDVGCGPGVIAKAVAETNPSIHICGYDGSADRINQARDNCSHLPNADFARGDAHSLPFDGESFDFTYCRFLVEYLADKQQAVSEMVRVLKPGGLLLLQDLDGQLVWHYPEDESLQRRVARTLEILAKSGFDPFVGRKLFSLMRAARLSDLDMQVECYHLYAGPINDSALDLWDLKLDIALPAAAEALGSHDEAIEFKRDYLAYLKDPDTITYSVLFTVVGRKV